MGYGYGGLSRKRRRRQAQSRRLQGGGGRRLQSNRRLQAAMAVLEDAGIPFGAKFQSDQRGGNEMALAAGGGGLPSQVAAGYYGATKAPGLGNLSSDCYIRGDYGAVQGLSQDSPADDFDNILVDNAGIHIPVGAAVDATFIGVTTSRLGDLDNANYAGKGITNLALTLSVDGVFPDGFDAESLRQQIIDRSRFRVVKGTGNNTTAVATFPAISMIVSLSNDRYGVDVPIKLLEGLWSIIGFELDVNLVGLASPDPAGYTIRPSLLVTYGVIPFPQNNSCGYPAMHEMYG